MLVAALVLTILAKIGALGRDMTLAAMFGAGVKVDAYFIANVIPGLLWLALLSSVAAVFLPMYVGAQQKEPQEAAKLAVEAVRTYLLLACGMMIATWLMARPIIEVSAAGSRPELIDLAVSITRIMAVGFVFTGYVGVQNALQQANGRYLWPLAAQPITHVVTITMIFVAAHFGSIKLAVIGAVLGWVVQAPLQRWQTRAYYRFTPGFKVRRGTLRRLSLLSGPVAIGVFLDQANIYIGIAIAAHFNEGAVSHLGYASRLALFLGNLVSWLTAYFLFPRIASHAARGNDRAAAQDLEAGVLLICGLTLPLLVISLLFAPELIGLIFGRGEFRGADVAATAAIFLPYVLGIVAIGLREMLNRVFFSYQRTTAPMVIGVAAALVNLGLGLWLSRRYGVPGIAMGATCAAALYVVLQVTILLSWRKNLLRWRTLGRLAALAAAALSSYLAARALLPAAATDAPHLARLFLGSAAIGIVYLALMVLFDRIFGLDLKAVVTDLFGAHIPPAPRLTADPEPI